MLLSAILLVAAFTNQPMLVSSDWLATRLDDPLVVIVEVGSQSDYDVAHIPGARFIARENIVADREGVPNEIPSEQVLIDALTRAGVGDSKRIVIYSRDPLLAARTWFTLDYLGHGSRASMLDGGFEQWMAAKLPVATQSSFTRPAPFTVDGRPYSLIGIDEVMNLVRLRGKLSGRLVAIDARPPRFYRGDESGKEVRRAGHIPDAINIPWTANLSSEHPPLLRSADQLREIYASAGLTNEAIAIAYCRTGMEASLTYFVLRYLGYDITLYDGSFVEWSRSQSTAVARSAGRE